MTKEGLKHDVIQYANSLGFGRVGITTAESLQDDESYLESWIREGRAGDMAYMAKNWERRARPADHLPGAKTVIALAASYFNPENSSTPSPRGEGGRSRHASGGPSGSLAGPDEGLKEPLTLPPSPQGEGKNKGRVARYAWGKDYHRVIGKRLDALARYIEALAPEARCKTFVDTGPLLERAIAQKAGVGFVGKNTMLITRGLGSWVFLGAALTTLELPPDALDVRSCGSCTLCIDACPTQALTQPYELDARRCIAYLTIELKDGITRDLRHKVGDWLFGCDICQEVCPHNTRVPASPIREFQDHQGVGRSLKLSDILDLKTDKEFQNRFAGTPLKRSKRHGLLRNACLVAAHQGREDLIPRLEELAENDPHPVAREHARWAVNQINSKQ